MWWRIGCRCGNQSVLHCLWFKLRWSVTGIVGTRSSWYCESHSVLGITSDGEINSQWMERAGWRLCWRQSKILHRFLQFALNHRSWAGRILRKARRKLHSDVKHGRSSGVPFSGLCAMWWLRLTRWCNRLIGRYTDTGVYQPAEAELLSDPSRPHMHWPQEKAR